MAIKPGKRIDWEAVERDYRTGKFTLRELEAKHGAGYARISNKAKQNGWTKDLADAVRQATNAVLIAEVATATATEAQNKTVSAVLAAAEVNAVVIRSHRKALQQLGERADEALSTLLTIGASVSDVREAAAVMSALESYSRIVKTKIDKEREAHGITTEDAPEDQRRRAIPIVFVDAEVREVSPD